MLLRNWLLPDQPGGRPLHLGNCSAEFAANLRKPWPVKGTYAAADAARPLQLLPAEVPWPAKGGRFEPLPETACVVTRGGTDHRLSSRRWLPSFKHLLAFDRERGRDASESEHEHRARTSIVSVRET